MLRRVIPCALAALALLGVAVVPWLGSDLPRAEARPESDPEPSSPENKLLAAEAALFFSLRPADFTGDDLLKAAFLDVDKEIERELRVSLSDVERVTFALVRGGFIKLVHVHKAYDRDKLKEAYVGGVDKFADKGFKDGAPPKMEVKEKKVGGRTIYYGGEWRRWTRGFCPIDKTTFAAGEVLALENFFKAKGKASAEAVEAVNLAGKHSLVIGLDGKRLMAAARYDREESDKAMREEMERFKDKSKDFEEKKKEEEQINFRAQKDKDKEEKAKEEKPDPDVDELFGPMRGPEVIMLLPYRPLLRAKYCLVTVDVKKDYTLKAKVTANGKEDVDETETAMKMALYVLRDMAVMLPKQERSGLGHLRPLTPHLKKAFEAAKVERKGNVLSATVSMTPEDGLAKKVRDAVAEEKKKSEEREKKWREERFKDKEKK